MKIAAFLLAASSAFAQVYGPTPGYVFGKGELRPIRGTAGASYIGSAVIDGAEAAAVSPDGVSAAVVSGGVLELRRGFDGGTATTTELARGVDSVSWSGSALVAYSASARRASIWRDVTKAAETVDLSSVDGVKALALDGDVLFVAASSGLYAASRGSVSRVADLMDPVALTTAGGEAYVADAGTNLIVAASAKESRTVAAVAKPVGLQVSKKRLLVASAQSRSIEVLDLETGNRIGAVELDFAPTRMERAGSLALLNQASADEPLYVLDSRDALQTYFVPGGQE
jgi:hypothetical protein